MTTYDCAISLELIKMNQYYERLDKFIEKEKQKKCGKPESGRTKTARMKVVDRSILYYGYETKGAE